MKLLTSLLLLSLVLSTGQAHAMMAPSNDRDHEQRQAPMYSYGHNQGHAIGNTYDRNQENNGRGQSAATPSRGDLLAELANLPHRGHTGKNGHQQLAQMFGRHHGHGRDCGYGPKPPVHPTPLPAALPLFGLGMAGLWGAKRFGKKQA